jgi:colanic acid/amylovoran biosynthesis glycosyltransferase
LEGRDVSPPASVPAPTLAVVLNHLGRFSERFIERHIRESFGGRTVVIARHAADASAIDKPVLEVDQLAQSLPQRLGATVGRMAAYARHAYWGVPAGVEAQRIGAFWREHGVGAVLAEFGPLGCWIAPVARAHGVPVFVYFRGHDASRKLRSAGTVRAYRRMASQVDGFFAVSGFLVDNLRRAGIEHANTHVIPSGANPRVFAPGRKERGLVVVIGRLVPNKGPHFSLRAFAGAAPAHAHARLVMVGDGPMRAECEALAQSLGVADRVEFVGSRDHRYVADLLGRAEVLLQQSVTAPSGETEGLPSVIQEAMAAGVVVVATRHAGIPEIVIDGQTGRLVDEHDIDGAAVALADVLADSAASERLAGAARRLAEERLDTALLQGKLEDVIVRTLERRRGGERG